MVGVATRVADLYCETATVCDVADFHTLDLRDEQIAAHILMLWSITEDFQRAEEAMQGKPPVAEILGAKLTERAAGYVALAPRRIPRSSRSPRLSGRSTVSTPETSPEMRRMQSAGSRFARLPSPGTARRGSSGERKPNAAYARSRQEAGRGDDLPRRP
jgi:hypothetical protein